MMLKSANLALSFLLELCVFAAFAYWGFNSSTGVVAILLGIGAPVLAIVFWGIFVAPRSVVKVSATVRTMLTLVVFGLGVVALFVAGQSTLAWVLLVVIVLNQVLLIVLKQRDA